MNNFYNPYLYTSNSNGFTGYYITDYSEVLNTAVPTSGDAVLFANLDQGMIYSKKLVNGVPTVQPYKITPIFQEVSKPQTPVNNNSEIMEMLKTLTAEVEKLKGDSDAK